MKPRQPPSDDGKVPIPEDVWRALLLFATPFATGEGLQKESQIMAVTHLQCKECKSEYPLEALYVCERCFGPLEVAYDHSRLAAPPRRCPRRHRRAAPADPGGTAEHLALRRLPAAPGRPSRALGQARLARGPAGGVHAADPRRPAGAAVGPARGVGQERRRQSRPTRSRTASSRSPPRGRGSWGFRRSRAHRRATSRTPWPRTGRRWDWSPTCSSRPTWRSRRCSPRACTGRNWSRWKVTTTTSTASARSCAQSVTGRS